MRRSYLRRAFVLCVCLPLASLASGCVGPGYGDGGGGFDVGGDYYEPGGYGYGGWGGGYGIGPYRDRGFGVDHRIGDRGFAGGRDHHDFGHGHGFPSIPGGGHRGGFGGGHGGGIGGGGHGGGGDHGH